MTILKTIIREPLVHFLLLGVAVFGIYSLTDQSPATADGEVIEVGQGELGQLFETFSRTWQRPPTEAEFANLVDGRIKEEVFYREAEKMGLDRDDTLVRRRMQQKMEFLLEPSAEELTPKDGELEAYLAANAKKFRTGEKLAFRQIFFDGNGSPDSAVQRARKARAEFAGPAHNSEEPIGDPTLLPERMELTEADAVAGVFGEEFAGALKLVPQGEWFGPLNSSFGVHLVRVDQKVEGYTPPLADVEKAVRLDWESAKRAEIAARRYDDLKKRYHVRVAWPTGMSASANKTLEAR
jgi:parvulin-like peptidyl-prolyl isomerase